MLRVNDYPLLIIPLNLVRSFIITYDKRAYTLFQYNIYFKYTTNSKRLAHFKDCGLKPMMTSGCPVRDQVAYTCVFFYRAFAYNTKA